MIQLEGGGIKFVLIGNNETSCEIGCCRTVSVRTNPTLHAITVGFRFLCSHIYVPVGVHFQCARRRPLYSCGGAGGGSAWLPFPGSLTETDATRALFPPSFISQAKEALRAATLPKPSV